MAENLKRKLKEENDNLKSLVNKNNATNKQIEAKDQRIDSPKNQLLAKQKIVAEKSDDDKDAEIDLLKNQLIEEKEKNKKLVAEKSDEDKDAEIDLLKNQLIEEKEKNKKLVAEKSDEDKDAEIESKISDQENATDNAEEIETKNVQESSREKIVEGIEKYIIRKRSRTNFFSTYHSWFDWLKKITAARVRTRMYENSVFVSCKLNFRNLFHFTEYQEFPIMSKAEIVIPVINKGWTRENTKAFILKRDKPTPVTTSFTEEITEPGIGKHFSLEISGRNNYSYANSEVYCLLVVFFRQSVNSNNDCE